MNIDMLKNLSTVISIAVMGLSVVNGKISNKLLDARIERKVQETLQNNNYYN